MTISGTLLDLLVKNMSKIVCSTTFETYHFSPIKIMASVQLTQELVHPVYVWQFGSNFPVLQHFYLPIISNHKRPIQN